LSFDATNDYIDVAGINLKQYPIVIINIWTKAYGNESTTYTRVLSDETGGNIGNMILFRRPSEDRVIFVCNDGSVHPINIAGAFPKDVWIMWTLIRVNNQFIRLLKNGVQIGSDVSIGDASTVGATTLTFGAEQWDKGAKYNGEIDSTYIHAVSSILTPDEIAKIYNEGNGTEDHIPVVRRLPVGTNGQRLQADSSTPEGIKWVTP